MSTDRRVPFDLPVECSEQQVGESAVVWHVIEDAFWVVCDADNYLDDDFLALTDGQQHVAVLSRVWAGIMNGGIFDPLYNSGGNFLPEAIAAAKAVGAETTMHLFEEIVEIVNLSHSDLRDQNERKQALDRHERDCVSDHEDLRSLVGPASEWFECAERFIDKNASDFYV